MLSGSRSTAPPDGPRPSGGVAAEARDLETAMRPLVDVALGAAEELEERVAPVHLRALQALEASGASHVSALAQALSLLPSTVSRLSDRLTAAGLITRGVSPVNRRATLLELTPAGRQVLDDLARARTRRLEAVLGTMAEADREALDRGLRAFAAATGVDGVTVDGSVDGAVDGSVDGDAPG